MELAESLPPALPPAVVLAGGLGTRLQGLFPGLPKPMAPIAGRPFLEHVLRHLKASGIQSVVLCVGHLAEVVRSHFGPGGGDLPRVAYSVEKEPAGTAGGIKLGASVAGTPTVFAMNGDTFVELDYAAMLRSHRERRAPVTVALARVDDAGRYGSVTVDEAGAIRAFGEKNRRGPGSINAGVYLLERAVLDQIPDGTSSFENDVLPGWVSKGALGFTTRGLFVDIGVPDDYHALASAPGAFAAATA